MACKNSFLLRDDLFIIRSLKSCLRNQLTSKQCGFHDTSHLNKVFSTETGMTPSKFRKICF
ncbi:AraC family transcriptional regulator [Lactiplantibacillus plantarum]